MLHPNQLEFIRMAIESKALSFGQFVLKSGRTSPYFFNAGKFQTGSQLATVSKAYAHTLVNSGVNFDLLFGPAYKGIPLASTTAVALSEIHTLSIPYCYNRKEAKDHGEGGSLVGAPLQGKVAIIDDVITAGTAIREVLEIIKAADAEPAVIVVGLDRQERGQGELSAIQELEQATGVPVKSIITLEDIMSYMQQQGNQELVDNITQYRNEYGV